MAEGLIVGIIIFGCILMVIECNDIIKPKKNKL
jgi:hypothetical protein